MLGVPDNNVSNYRVMGQANSSPLPFMLKHLLKTHVSMSDLEMCLEIIKEYNPWFPSDENLMDIGNLDGVWMNIEKAVKHMKKYRCSLVCMVSCLCSLVCMVSCLCSF